MANSILGVYFAPEHGIQSDRDYIAALQPPVIRILDPDVQQIADMHALCPNAIIAPRTWAIDDGSDEDHPSKQVNRLMADPIGTGRDHAQQYAAQWDRWTSEAIQRGLKLPNVDRILFNSANEPNQGGTPDKIAAYCIAFLDRCTELGICACAPCLGVGWPDNTGPETPVDWTPYAGLEQAIKRNGGMLSVHEYFYKTGPQDGWGWLAGRHLQCPFDVPILLGEIGIDNYVYNERWQAEPEATRGNRGWQGNVSPDVYAEMIEAHLRGSDRRVVAGLIFITDFRNNSWESFNTRAAHNALLARKDRMIPQVLPPSLPSIPQPPEPVTVRLPSIATGAQPTTYWVRVRAANLRSGPSTEFDLLAELPQGTSLTFADSTPARDWLQVRYGDKAGWVMAALLSANPVAVPMLTGDGPTQPAPEPPSTPTAAGIIEPRVAQAILKIESGGRTHGEDGRIIIRFEAHVFKTYLPHDEPIWKAYFRTDSERPWTNQEWRKSATASWQQIHTGNQADEYAAFDFARGLYDPEGAYKSISMGSAQIMGFNHARIGYASAADMYAAFVDAQLQTIGFINFCLSDSALIEAMRRKDWREIAKRYNGAGQIDTYAPLLERAYRELSA